MGKLGWAQPFEFPVEVNGRAIPTLRDAADYVMALPKAEQEKPHWQLAIEMLIVAAEGRGPLLFARIGMLKALKHGEPVRQPAPTKKAARKYILIR